MGGKERENNFLHPPLLPPPPQGIFFSIFTVEAKPGGPRGGQDVLEKIKISSLCGESKQLML